MKQYRVFAFYDYPPVQRSAIIDAETEQQAMLRALLQGHVPAYYQRNASGNLAPVYWSPTTAGESRWPTVHKNRTLIWDNVINGKQYQRKLRFDFDEITQQPQ